MQVSEEEHSAHFLCEWSSEMVIRHALHKSASGGSYSQIRLKCNAKMGRVGFAQALTDAC